ncbi:hypothetical protein BGZ73_001805, partial [Actinomortierella ambigua]
PALAHLPQPLPIALKPIRPPKNPPAAAPPSTTAVPPLPRSTTIAPSISSKPPRPRAPRTRRRDKDDLVSPSQSDRPPTLPPLSLTPDTYTSSATRVVSSSPIEEKTCATPQEQTLQNLSTDSCATSN